MSVLYFHILPTSIGLFQYGVSVDDFLAISVQIRPSHVATKMPQVIEMDVAEIIQQNIVNAVSFVLCCGVVASRSEN